MTLHANIGLCVIIVRFSYHANLGPEVGIACKSRVYIYECKYRSQLERSFMENLDQEKRRKKIKKRCEEIDCPCEYRFALTPPARAINSATLTTLQNQQALILSPV
jgi:hypothetical protein